MKYQVGDLVFVKDVNSEAFHRNHPRLPLLVHSHLIRTFGIITAVEKYNHIFKGSSEKDNSYVWYSQVDNKEYHFYEDEVDGEVIK
jgi:hypothetical protein